MTSKSKPPSSPARRAKHVAERFGFSQPMLYKEINAGRFPSGTYITDRIRVWFDDELENEMDRRISLHNGGRAA